MIKIISITAQGIYLKHLTINTRHQRSYSPEDLMILQGPKDDFKPGSQWKVGDLHGYAELLLMDDSKAYFENTLYIEHLFVKENLRGKGYGRSLYDKVEKLARNIGVKYIQLDSEEEAVWFWLKLGFRKLDVLYYQNKTSMIKEI